MQGYVFHFLLTKALFYKALWETVGSITLVKTHSRKQNIKMLLEDIEIFCFFIFRQQIDTRH